MKKLLTILLAAMLSLTVVFMTACKDDVTGVYKIQSMTYSEGQSTMTFNIGDDMPTGGKLTTDFLKLELKDGGTFVMSGELYGNDDTFSGSWSVDGETLKMTAEGETINGKIKDDVITISGLDGSDQMTIVFKKA
ncbi:MAG: hypothetical protein IJV95_00225 [Clostridia bacterium]|nr:hypothetical protein [Clostridia bacterium]